MMDSEIAIIRMLRYGARGYIVKDSDAEIFRKALDSVRDHDFYINELVSNKMFHYANNPKEDRGLKELQFTDREMSFLKLVCSEKTYKEIAAEIGVSPRTVDSYRDSLFEKIGVNSRTGLVIYAIKAGIVKIEGF
jgi:DNA-binding NarL/FixJ family response regulator